MKQILLKTWLIVVCLLVIGGGRAWGETFSGTFNKITTTDAFTTGKYVIVGGSTANAMAAYSTYWASSALGSAINSQKSTITNPDAAVVWDITKDGSNYIISQTSGGTTKYVGFTGTSNNDNSFNTTNTDNKTKFTASVSSGTFTLTNVNYNSRKLQYNSSSPRFGNYSNQTGVTIFKLQDAGTPVATPTNLSAGTPTSTGTTLSWGAVEHATAYKVEYKVSTAGAWTAVTPNPTTNSCELTGLTPSTTYAWQVTALSTENGYSDGSAASGTNFTTAAPASHKAYFYVNGTLQNAGGTDFTEGASITFPAAPSVDGVTFVGWTKTANYSNATDAPSDLCKAATMGDADVTYYAVFATAGEGGSSDYTLVESALSDWSGDYLIVYNNLYAMNTHSGNQNANTFATYSNISSYYTESTKTIASNPTTDALVYRAAKTTNGYSLYCVSDESYLGITANTTGTGSKLRWNTSYTASADDWTLGVGSIGNVGSNTLYIRWNNNNSQERFAAYSSTGQQAIQLFKKGAGSTYSDYCTTVSTKATPTLSFENSTYNATMGEAFDAPTLTKTDGINVTYSSTNTGVATVNAENGTVALVGAGTTTITASFAGNETYKAASASYELVVAAAPAQKYKVTIETPENGTLTIKDGETVINSGDEVEEGTELTIEVEAADGYRFKNWGYKDGDNAWIGNLTANFTHIMPSAPCSFKATFEAIPIYTIAFNVNGVEVQSENLKEGAAVAAYANPEAINGKVFTGWIETATVVGETPAYVTPAATATKNVTYYAVFATQTGEASLTTATLNAVGKSTTGYNKGTKDDNQGGTWNYNASVNNQSGTLYFGLNTNENNYYIASPVFEHNITKITLKAYNGSSTTDRKLLICSSNTTAQPSTGDLAEVTVKKSEAFTTTYEVDLSNAGNFSQFYIYAAAALGVSEVNVSYGSNPTYSNYTTLPDAHATITIASACTDGETCYSTYSNTSAFVVPEGLTVSTVGVDDEGKLVVNSYNTGDVVAANTGVMVSGAAGDHNVTLTNAAATEAPGANNLHPSSEAMTGDNLFYRLTMHNGTQIGFWWGAADGAAFNLAANKAYLAVPTSVAANSNLRLWFGDETITGIEAIETADDSAIFNLQGQRMNRIQKGVNIINGKKVLR